MEHTVHNGFACATVGEEVFTDLDYADDVALLAQMLKMLLLSLSVMNEEAKLLGLHINGKKTKIQQIGEPYYSQSHLTVAGESVEIVDSFVYLGSQMDRRGGSDLEIRRCIEIRDLRGNTTMFITRPSTVKISLHRPSPTPSCNLQ